MPDISILGSLIEFGLAGFIIFIIIRPILVWMMERADGKDQYIQTLLDNHFKHDEEKHKEMVEVLRQLPDKTSEAILVAIGGAFVLPKRKKNK